MDAGSAQRNANRSRVVHALRQRGAMSRSDLAEIGLSRSTVASVVAELLDAGTVVEVADAPRNGRVVTGRPPTLVGLHGGSARPSASRSPTGRCGPRSATSRRSCSCTTP
ncbi:hypothetical protein [Dactylosporangium darangshiense]|uniref:hypothetical protein n=1 Tax=Dactylosporangium darangshiense TaxID=579108 RepID=UPI00363C22A1